MGLDLSAFQPGSSPLLDGLHIREGLTSGQLGPLAAVLAVLLAYAAYTDVFCGRIIRNTTVAAVFAVNVAALGLIVPPEHITSHLIGAGITTAVVFVMAFMGAFKEGDLKLYTAMALLFGSATGVYIFISFTVMILYGLRGMVANQLRRRADAKRNQLGKPGDYRTYVPAGPGFAVAFPLMLMFAGVDAGHGVLLFGVELLTVAVVLWFGGLMRKADEIEAKQEQAERDRAEAEERLALSRAALAARPAPSPVSDRRKKVIGVVVGLTLLEAAVSALRRR